VDWVFQAWDKSFVYLAFCVTMVYQVGYPASTILFNPIAIVSVIVAVGASFRI
jgi:hypothetical protein